jgi:hypothetical protein
MRSSDSVVLDLIKQLCHLRCEPQLLRSAGGLLHEEWNALGILAHESDPAADVFFSEPVPVLPRYVLDELAKAAGAFLVGNRDLNHSPDLFRSHNDIRVAVPAFLPMCFSIAVLWEECMENTSFLPRRGGNHVRAVARQAVRHHLHSPRSRQVPALHLLPLHRRDARPVLFRPAHVVPAPSS